MPTGPEDLLTAREPSAYQARVRPHRTACIDPSSGETLTYAALDQRVGALAGWLKAELGDTVGQRVATLCRNSLDQVALFFACQRAGAVYTPLNWRLAAAELGALLTDAEPGLLIYDEEFRAAGLAAAEAAGTPRRVASASLRAQSEAARPYLALADADRPCVILYTSGTTGRPKGVVITCANAFYACLNMSLVGEIGPLSVLLCDVPLFHTVGLFAVSRTTLTFGGTLVMSDRFAPDLTLQRLSDPALGITHYFGVPQIASALLQSPAYADADLSRLKAIFTGGAALPPPLIERFAAAGITLVNGYGMSEAGTTIHMPLDPEPTRREPGAIGHPAPLMSVRLVGREGEDVQDGEAGEIWIAGPAVTSGYWRQPEATAAAFSDGWFRTGDLARREPTGVYRLLDRLKDMYISGGENVYPAEVEASLLAHPDVLDVAVVGAPHPRWGESGVAFVVARAESGLDAASILAHCAARIAKYKHPDRVIFVDEIARTPSGKVQKALLRDHALRSDPAA